MFLVSAFTMKYFLMLNEESNATIRQITEEETPI